MTISYVAKERALRSNSDDHPGVLCLSSRIAHNRGSWVIDRHFEPSPHRSGPVPLGDSKYGDFEDRAVTISAADLVAELAGPGEVLAVMGMLRDVCHLTVDTAFRVGDFGDLEGSMRLTHETVDAIRERWPVGPDG